MATEYTQRCIVGAKFPISTIKKIVSPEETSIQAWQTYCHETKESYTTYKTVVVKKEVVSYSLFDCENENLYDLIDHIKLRNQGFICAADHENLFFGVDLGYDESCFGRYYGIKAELNLSDLSELFAKAATKIQNPKLIFYVEVS